MQVIDHRGYLIKISQRPWAETFYTFSRAGVLRGMHWQEGADKLVHLISGAVIDVAVDLKTGRVVQKLMAPGSEIYVPSSFAHGFYAFTDSIMLYQMSEAHDPAKERGIHWNSFGFTWPLRGEVILSDRDRGLPALEEVCALQ